MNILRKKNIVIFVSILLLFLFFVYIVYEGTKGFRTMPCVQSQILHKVFVGIDQEWKKKGCPEIFVPSDYHWGMGGDNQFYISTNQINIQGTNYHCGITLRMDAYFKNPGVLTYTHEKVFLWIGDDGKVVLEPHKNRWWLP